MSSIPNVIKVKAIWDESVKVWVATSTNLPGLVVEAASLDELANEVRLLVPQLLALQHQHETSTPVSIEMSQRLSAVA